MKIEEGFAIGMKFSELCKKEKDMNNLSKEYTDFCKKKLVTVDEIVKELEKYHGGLHPVCNICKLINSLKQSKVR